MFEELNQRIRELEAECERLRVENDALRDSNVSAGADALRGPLQSLKEEYPSELSALLLEHTYTESSFSLKALKGDDRARVQSLFYAAEQSGFRAHLGLVSLYQMGELEYGDDEAMGEIYEEALTIEQWKTPADRPAHLGRFAITEECLVGEDAFGEEEPDESYAEGFTGNAGCTMEYWYRRAAVVLWPREAEAAIRTEYNFSETARHFRDTSATRWERKARPLENLPPFPTSGVLS